MKTDHIQFRVNAQDKKDFTAYCKTIKYGKTVSEVMREYVVDCARDYRWKKNIRI